MGPSEASTAMLERQITFEEKTGQKLQGACLAAILPLTPIKVYCFLLLLAVLLVAVVALSVLLVTKREEVIVGNQTPCPRDWIVFGSKCFYFSEDTRNWTFSKNACLTLEAQLARFDNMEELNVLRRYMGPSDHWIGLRRESPSHPWRWTDNTEYNNMAVIRGVGPCAYLNNEGISSAKEIRDRKWICSRDSLQCPGVSSPL